MNTLDQLRERVFSLSEQFSWLGMSPDIPSMTLQELEAALRLLARLEGGENGTRN
ncbi:MAG: hypothetical protein K2Q19_02250 [Rhodocyclaceae bacterium]|jgi:hypothetical protein|nr:hypothetical protein [Rhodocyclaceae bacterium]